jgi:hypothetical protein
MISLVWDDGWMSEMIVGCVIGSLDDRLDWWEWKW